MTATMTSDRTSDLVQRARTGDRAAFGELFRAHRARLLERIRARLGRKLRASVEAEDVLQETFLRAFESVAHFTPRGPDSFFHWLGAIAEHLILSASQKKRPAPLELEREPAAGAVSPSRALRREERLERLESALASLPAEQKEIVLLARLEGLSTAEIAKRLGKSPESVRQILSRGLKRLRGTLSATESLHLPAAGLRRPDPDREGGHA
jgi:RNA polymerase sigma-70 factor (ECF subfamily)